MRRLLWSVLGALALSACPGSILSVADASVDSGAAVTCGADTTLCGTTCVVLTTDDQHCGTCTRACGATDSCANGACLPDDCSSIDCASSQVCVNDTKCVQRKCVNVTCDSGKTCDQGVCVPEACGAMPCQTGFTCSGGACVDVECQGVSCTGGLQCLRGECGAPDAGPGVDAGAPDAGAPDAGGPPSDGGASSLGFVGPGGATVQRSASYRNVGVVDSAPPTGAGQGSTGYKNRGGFDPVMKP